MKTFYSNGKLLLTGEYVVLDGALSLALPTKLGQSLTIKPIEDSKIIWKSLDEKGAIWFEDIFEIDEISGLKKRSNMVSNRLIEILNTTKTLNSKFLNSNTGFEITTKLTFPRNWGLGTSSTLINNIAQWAQVDPYKLLALTFGGSGYDIACAQSNTPIIYRIDNENPNSDTVVFNPGFKNQLYFVYLNRKQDSREGIAHYKKHIHNSKQAIEAINQITKSIIESKELNIFEQLINKHEEIIANITKQTPVKKRLFGDFNGSIKSLGAWGGDFILVASQDNPTAYFQRKGFSTILNYSELIK